MNTKETLIKLGTGIVAKFVRHALTAAGGTATLTSGDGPGVNEQQLAAGIATVLVSWGWSVWEDRVKKRQALAQPFPPLVAADTDKPKTPTPTP